MGQAAVDLPDPLSATPVGSSTNTDDLLAQMAGEEIERLLAEADEAPVPAVPSIPVATITHSHAPPAVASTAAVSSLLEPPVSPVSAPVASPAAVADADLDALFTQLASTSGTPDAAGAPAPPVDVPAPATASTDSEPSNADALAQEMLEDAAQHAAGKAGAAAALTANVAAVTPAPVARNTSDSIPFYLRILSWFNSPLDAYPDHVRDVVGKIAILTTVNAISVLAYVLIFRSR